MIYNGYKFYLLNGAIPSKTLQNHMFIQQPSLLNQADLKTKSNREYRNLSSDTSIEPKGCSRFSGISPAAFLSQYHPCLSLRNGNCKPSNTFFFKFFSKFTGRMAHPSKSVFLSLIQNDMSKKSVSLPAKILKPGRHLKQNILQCNTIMRWRLQ